MGIIKFLDFSDKKFSGMIAQACIIECSLELLPVHFARHVNLMKLQEGIHCLLFVNEFLKVGQFLNYF